MATKTKKRLPDDGCRHGKRHRNYAAICHLPNLTGGPFFPRCLTEGFTTPVSRIIRIVCEETPHEQGDDMASIVPTRAVRKGHLQKVPMQLSTKSFMPPCIRLPRKVPNIFSFSNGGDIELSHGLYADFLNVYGWESKCLLRHAEAQEYDISPNTDSPDPLYPLVSSGTVPPLNMRRRQQSDWFAPQSRQWALDNYIDRQPCLTPRLRGKLVKKIAKLTDAFEYSPYTFHLAVTLMDKTLACAPFTPDATKMAGLGKLDRGALQRCVCAWFWIACKMEEVGLPSCSYFVSANLCSQEQLLQDEIDVCVALKFRLCHVTPIHYAHEYLLACNASACDDGVHMGPFLHDMLHYLLELSRFAYELAHLKPSLIASGTLLLARVTLKICSRSPTAPHAKDYWNTTLEYYTGYSVEELKDTVKTLHSYQRDAASSTLPTLKAIFKKYNQARYMSVSLEAPPNIERLFRALDSKRELAAVTDAISIASSKAAGAAARDVISVDSSDGEDAVNDVVSISSSEGEGADTDIIYVASSTVIRNNDQAVPMPRRRRIQPSKLNGREVFSLLDDSE